MPNQPEYSVSITKTYNANPGVIFELFKNNTVFKLTGADMVENDFIPGGLFRLTFNNRGVISGRFIEITSHRITAAWNVTGFEKPDEADTSLQIEITGEDNHCVFNLNHTHIKFKAAAEAKQRAWTEISDAIEMYLTN
jgi:hypothetical protein